MKMYIPTYNTKVKIIFTLMSKNSTAQCVINSLQKLKSHVNHLIKMP